MPKPGYQDARRMGWNVRKKPIRCSMGVGKRPCPAAPIDGVTMCAQHFGMELRRVLEALMRYRAGHQAYLWAAETLVEIGGSEANRDAVSLLSELDEPSENVERAMPVRTRQGKEESGAHDLRQYVKRRGPDSIWTVRDRPYPADAGDSMDETIAAIRKMRADGGDRVDQDKETTGPGG